MNNGKTRASLIGVAAVYLLHIGWELFQGRNESGSGMSPAARWAFIVFFALCGAALLVYAVRIWRQAGRAQEEKTPPEDENSLK